jgi:prepilin-type N-terminal cleavage/methylation domain-containing protein
MNKEGLMVNIPRGAKHLDPTTRIFSAHARRVQVGTDAKSAPFLRPKKGFTLVEVIVVLVILAILMSIAVPALTGYIDKARVMQFKVDIRTLRVATQTLILEDIAANGGAIKVRSGVAGDIFSDVGLESSDATDPAEYIYKFNHMSMTEFEKLAGDSLNINGQLPHGWNVQTDKSGAIKICYLNYRTYFAGDAYPVLAIYWVDDYSASDPLGKHITYMKSQSGSEKTIGETLMPSFNFYKVTNDWSAAERLNW